jgi:hypothetical protein
MSTRVTPLTPLRPDFLCHADLLHRAGPLYSSRARIGHAWIARTGPACRDVLAIPVSLRVTDDFGNSVAVGNDPLAAFLRQAHDAA